MSQYQSLYTVEWRSNLDVKRKWILSHLSLFTVIITYLILIVEHLVMDGFVFNNQLDVITVMIPVAVLGLVYDFILNNCNLKNSYKVFGKLCILFIFFIRIAVNLQDELGDQPLEALEYIHYLLFTIPFFIATYHKETHRRKLIFTLIGITAIGFTYLYLANQTEALNLSAGAIIYLASYTLMIYSAGEFDKLPFIGAIISCANAIVLLYLRFLCFSERVLSKGWDDNFSFYFEIIMIGALLLMGIFVFLSKTKLGQKKI